MVHVVIGLLKQLGFDFIAGNKIGVIENLGATEVWLLYLSAVAAKFT